MGRVQSYARASAMVMALTSKLLAPSHHDRLLKTRDVPDAVGVLSETEYAPYLGQFAGRSFELPDLEKALFRSYIDTYEKVLRAATLKTARAILECIYSRYEVECLKSILSSAMAGAPAEQAMTHIMPVGEYTYSYCSDLLAKKELRQIIDGIGDSAIRSLLHSTLAECERSQSTLPAELAIDRYLLESAWELANDAEFWDRRPLRELIGTEIDVFNITSLLRVKRMDVPPDLLQKILVRARYRLGSEFDRASETPDTIEAMRALASGYYADPLNRAVDLCESSKSLLPAEMALRRYLARRNLSAFIGYPFNAGLLLAYLNLKWNEMRDVRAILVGKAEGMDSSRIGQLLVSFGAFD